MNPHSLLVLLFCRWKHLVSIQLWKSVFLVSLLPLHASLVESFCASILRTPLLQNGLSASSVKVPDCQSLKYHTRGDHAW
ncbi:hypothetical protein CPB84DRAFT_1780091 [Gymnopilus junonius]|uniref:Uncharacterized protein n=1 Tax=Gymnopilus junonius TaxID=109634 RepID=A0A9P5TLL1_GYMJU|nr:hypothetical protein CPB84DRAFT_1780091 [Gymnopilus junonius]